MSENANKKIGIVIPEECGKAEEYELTAIMYRDENSDAAEEEYQVFITEDDYNEGKAFAVLNANMNPEILLYPDEDHEGIGCLEYDLVENERISLTEDGKKGIIISKVLAESESKWIMAVVDSSSYLNVQPKTVNEINDVIEIS